MSVGQVGQKSGLMRFEFLEFLVRIANLKLIETKICTTYKDALHHLIENNLKKHYTTQPWQAFRDQQLWDFPVNDVLKENMESITKLHKRYHTPEKRYMSYADAIDLMTKDSKAGLTSKQAKYCIGFCKMTVVDEVMDFNQCTKV